MNRIFGTKNGKSAGKTILGIISVILIALVFPFNIFSAEQDSSLILPQRRSRAPLITDSVSTGARKIRPPRQPLQMQLDAPEKAEIDSALILHSDSLAVDSVLIAADTLAADSINIKKLEIDEKMFQFNPDPTRAVWLSALFPGLGQIYNRRYWKLPIIVGGYMGLAYATTWNNRMLSDYTNAYRDIMDTDPTTKSYMDFFPPTTKEEDLDKTWLTNTLKSRKNYFRQNRDLCIICMVGVYLLAMVDAYVDASLSQFDITPDLSIQVAPTLIQDSRDKLPAVGMHWALCF